MDLNPKNDNFDNLELLTVAEHKEKHRIAKRKYKELIIIACLYCSGPMELSRQQQSQLKYDIKRGHKGPLHSECRQLYANKVAQK
jgi:hypothetical protein